jgi:uncharacterized lipoprotein YddW (UPF0748 family)
MKAAWEVLCFIIGFLFVFALQSTNAQESRESRAAEIRGVWVHPGTFGPDKSMAIPKIQSTLDAYEKAGINMAMVLVKSTSGHVYYQSEIGARDPAYDWDFLGAFLEECSKRNIAVHPWFCVFTEGALQGRVREHPEWLIRSRRSELVPIVNPALPEVRRYEIDLIREVVSKYPVEWVHLDYLRYPCEPTEDYFSFDATTRMLFKDYSGEDVATLQATDSGNPLWNEWIEWNGDQVTQFLRELRRDLSGSGKQVKLSAAVFPDARNAKVLVGQDWERWAQEGLADMLCPMLYTSHQSSFEKYVRRAVAIARGRCLLGIGIGIETAHGKNSPAGVLRQMQAARELGGNGSVLFSSGSLTDEFLTALARGIPSRKN